MNNAANQTLIVPDCIDELERVVAAQKRVLAVGNRTKPMLSAGVDAALVSLQAIRGIVEYEPSEFTFTALAGTPIAEIAAALAEKKQYLPFDPMLVDASATIGGTVGSGLSGPGRFRYGGIRDFLLAVQFLSGDGETIKAGGKVVKNAAGFDIPKLMVGSLGRIGVMTQLTFKVFPQPLAQRTLLVRCESHEQATGWICSAAVQRWELDAIDYRPDQKSLFLRLAGPERANEAIAREIKSTWDCEVLDWEAQVEFWRSVRELTWSPESRTFIKVPITPALFLRLHQSFANEKAFHCHLSVAGNVLWIGVDDEVTVSTLSSELDSLECCGLVVRGEHSGCLIGRRNPSRMESAIKQAMDPAEKFPPL